MNMGPVCTKCGRPSIALFPSVSPASLVIKSLRDNPGEWSCTQYTLRHQRSGLQIWIANGASFIAGYESKIPFQVGWIDAFRVWWAFRRWQRTCFVNQFTQSS